VKPLIVAAVRLLLGIIFILTGINGYFSLFGLDPFLPTSPAAQDFFYGTGYLLPLLKSVELICGLLLFFNRWVPLALLTLAPVVVNILLFHLTLDPANLWMGLTVTVFLLILFYSYRQVFFEIVKRS
jgi:uncharacterized membrane protein YphA (DoxX/SURF4 family)